jgi:phosphoheptose isomerase
VIASLENGARILLRQRQRGGCRAPRLRLSGRYLMDRLAVALTPHVRAAAIGNDFGFEHVFSVRWKDSGRRATCWWR